MQDAPAQTQTAKGAAESAEPSRPLQRQGRRIAEARATVPDSTFTRTVALPGDSAPAGDLVIAALARALRATPDANAAHRDALNETYERINVGLVLPDNTGSTLVTLHEADTMTAEQITLRRSELAGRLAAGTLTAPETAGATCSVIDLSESGVDAHTPVIVPPHALALAIGGVRPDRSITLTAAADMRVLSPFTVAALLDRLASELGAA